MFTELKKTWQHLKNGEPGKRFQEYHRLHQAKARGKASRIVSLVVGTAIIAVGIVALPAPGPGTLVIGIGAAFIARESLAVARFLDWIELRLRALYLRATLAWRRASLAKRVGVAVLGFGVLGLAVYVAYSVTLGA